MNISLRTILSKEGSNRATAYDASNKIVTSNGKIFVTWLDNRYNVMVKTYYVDSKSWSESVNVGQSSDNHGGAALTMDKEGYLHIVFGAHHESFKYRHTSNPNDASEWTEEEIFGSKGSYPSLVCDSNNTLYCTYRSSATSPWSLMLQSKKKGASWTKEQPIVKSAPAQYGYSDFGGTLTVSSSGILHLSFSIVDNNNREGKELSSKALGYLRSLDGGRTWISADGQQIELPVSYETENGRRCFVENLDMLNGSIALDLQGNPWIAAINSELPEDQRSGVLWHYSDRHWKSIDLSPHIPHDMLVTSHGIHRGIQEISISYDRMNCLYVLCSVGPKWGVAPTDILLLTSQDRGNSFEAMQISEPDSTTPSWLPNISKRVSGKLLDTPSLIYTHGKWNGNISDVIFASLDSST